jgi:D-alanyl-lipoteichoic acid acyltransferase DltB (MBOAT superfamily)
LSGQIADLKLMDTASFELLAFAFGAAIVYNLWNSRGWRQAVLLVANACFVYTFVTDLRSVVPMLVFVIIGYIGVRMARRKGSDWAYFSILIVVIGSFIWLKKYSFLPSTAFLHFAYTTIGLSFILFRVLHLIIDLHAGALQETIDPISYLNYTLNFMTLVSGPIQRYEDFEKTAKAVVLPRPTLVDVGEGLHRVVLGFFKVAVLSIVFSRLQNHMLTALGSVQPMWHRVAAVAIAAASYTFYLYLNFTGYIDLMIGLGRFFGFRLPENFDRPLSADNFMNFWNRWHITLSNWFKSYVFNPLLMAMMRRTFSVAMQSFVAVPAIFFTFFLVGIWHGRTSEFLFFGFLQGLGVAGNLLYAIILEQKMGRKRYNALASNRIYIALCRGLTFTWFTFTLLWFWSNWSQLSQITQILGSGGSLLVFPAVFVAATLVLSLFNVVRDWALGVRWQNVSVVLSPYTLTVLDTVLAIGCFVVVTVLQHNAPPVIYKAF